MHFLFNEMHTPHSHLLPHVSRSSLRILSSSRCQAIYEILRTSSVVRKNKENSNNTFQVRKIGYGSLTQTRYTIRYLDTHTGLYTVPWHIHRFLYGTLTHTRITIRYLDTHNGFYTVPRHIHGPLYGTLTHTRVTIRLPRHKPVSIRYLDKTARCYDKCSSRESLTSVHSLFV